MYTWAGEETVNGVDCYKYYLNEMIDGTPNNFTYWIAANDRFVHEKGDAEGSDSFARTSRSLRARAHVSLVDFSAPFVHPPSYSMTPVRMEMVGFNGYLGQVRCLLFIYFFALTWFCCRYGDYSSDQI